MSTIAHTSLAALIASIGVLAGCAATTEQAGGGASDTLKSTIGPEGGELTGAVGSKLEGVHVVIPAGALSTPTEVEIRTADPTTPLPAAATRCGQTFEILPAGLQLAQPASVTLPFDQTTVETNNRFEDEVKVWSLQGDHWGQEQQTDSTEGRVTINMQTLTDVAPGVNAPADVDVVRFKLYPNPKFLKCFAQYPDDPSRQPRADVLVVRGEQRDSLRLYGRYLKSNLAFDMFTVQNSSLDAAGVPDPSFKNFGLAWYQSDLEARNDGYAHVDIRTILLDQIFGFDPAAPLAPTSTLHLGFWFNDPNDAAPCGFDPSTPTPFNGDHKAGPLAMITVPNASTNLGPLCTKVDDSVSPPRCSP